LLQEFAVQVLVGLGVAQQQLTDLGQQRAEALLFDSLRLARQLDADRAAVVRSIVRLRSDSPPIAGIFLDMQITFDENYLLSKIPYRTNERKGNASPFDQGARRGHLGIRSRDRRRRSRPASRATIARSAKPWAAYEPGLVVPGSRTSSTGLRGIGEPGSQIRAEYPVARISWPSEP
jgi:hypothetical protein